MRINKNRKIVDAIRRRLKVTKGHCPCRATQTDDTICPCVEMINTKHCHCQLFTFDDEENKEETE